MGGHKGLGKVLAVVIAITAIAIVLLLWLSGQGNLAPPISCITHNSQYYCAINSYKRGGDINVAIMQNTSTEWVSWGYYFCSGCTLVNGKPSGATYNISSAALASGMVEVRNLALVPPAGTPSAAGTLISGRIWICWTNATYLTSSCISGANTVNFVQLGTLFAKST